MRKALFCTPYKKLQAIRHDYAKNRADGMQFKEAYYRACYDNLTTGKLRLIAEVQLPGYGWRTNKTPLVFGMCQGNYSE